jgi:hypothetical protein
MDQDTQLSVVAHGRFDAFDDLQVEGIGTAGVLLQMAPANYREGVSLIQFKSTVLAVESSGRITHIAEDHAAGQAAVGTPLMKGHSALLAADKV